MHPRSLKYLQYLNKKIGRLTLIELLPANGKASNFLCLCDCGKQTKSSAYYLLRGKIFSCGCYNKEICGKRFKSHGYTTELHKRRIYKAWLNMKRRCFNPCDHKYSYYGARGITVCKRWMKFENFILDMGDRPLGRYSIDRINNDGNYEPSNCRWATDIQQANNKRKALPY